MGKGTCHPDGCGSACEGRGCTALLGRGGNLGPLGAALVGLSPKLPGRDDSLACSTVNLGGADGGGDELESSAKLPSSVTDIEMAIDAEWGLSVAIFMG